MSVADQESMIKFAEQSALSLEIMKLILHMRSIVPHDLQHKPENMDTANILEIWLMYFDKLLEISLIDIDQGNFIDAFTGTAINNLTIAVLASLSARSREYLELFYYFIHYTQLRQDMAIMIYEIIESTNQSQARELIEFGG
jgi:hypothetical protein